MARHNARVLRIPRVPENAISGIPVVPGARIFPVKPGNIRIPEIFPLFGN